MSSIARDYGQIFEPVLELTPLRYLVAIAETGGITAAARRLRVSQPAISVAVKKLEAHLGSTLLLRGSAGATLTPAGIELVRHARETLVALRTAEDQVRAMRTGESGRFVIGCYHSFGAFFLPEMLRRLTIDAPGIELTLWEGTSEEVRNAVVDRTVHFGLLVSPRPQPELVLVKMFKDVVGVFAPGQLSERERLAVLARGPLYHVERVAISRRVVTALADRKLLPQRVMACGDLELVKSLVLNGAGAAVLPLRVAIYNTPEGALRIADPTLPTEIDTAYLAFRADLQRTRAATRLKTALIARGQALHRAVELPLRGATG
jgi:DNA-binding transcriptional LysR family regulator